MTGTAPVDDGSNTEPVDDMPEPNDVPEPNEDEPSVYTGCNRNLDARGRWRPSATLLKLLSRHPFWDVYTQTEGQKLGFRGWLAFFLEIILNVVVLAIVIGIAAAVAWKTLAPIPRLPHLLSVVGPGYSPWE